MVGQLNDIERMINSLNQRIIKIREKRKKIKLRELTENEIIGEIKISKDKKQEQEKQEDELKEQDIKEKQKKSVVLCQREQADSLIRKQVIINEVAWMGTKLIILTNG